MYPPPPPVAHSTHLNDPPPPPSCVHPAKNRRPTPPNFFPFFFFFQLTTIFSFPLVISCINKNVQFNCIPSDVYYYYPELNMIFIYSIFRCFRMDKCKLGAIIPSGAFSMISWLLITQFGHDTYQIEAKYLSYRMVSFV